MRSRHLPLRGHLVSHDPWRFPVEFNELSLQIQESQQKSDMHQMLTREWLNFQFMPRSRDKDSGGQPEGFRIPTGHFLTLAQSLAVAAYGRPSSIEFPEGQEAWVRDEQQKTRPCARLRISCERTLFFDLDSQSRPLKTVLLVSGTEAAVMLLDAMAQLTLNAATLRERAALAAAAQSPFG